MFIFCSFVVVLTFGSFVVFVTPKYPNYLGGVVCVVGSKSYFCAYSHTIYFRFIFSKLSSIGFSVFWGFESL